MHTTVRRENYLLKNGGFLLIKIPIFDAEKSTKNIAIFEEEIPFLISKSYYLPSKTYQFSQKVRFRPTKAFLMPLDDFTKFNQFESDFFWFKPALTSLNQL